MAKKNIIAIEKVFEGAYIREREEDDGQKYIIASEAAFSTISWNCNSLEDDGIILTQDENNENIWTISNGKESKTIKVEKQIHQKVGKTWKVDGKKFDDGTTIKLNGKADGTFEVWSSDFGFRDNGTRKWKRVAIAKSEDLGRKALKKAITEKEKSLKVAKEA